MEKVLIIGGAGFVGGHLIQFLKSMKDLSVFATKLENEQIDSSLLDEQNIINLDIRIESEVNKTLTDIKPDYIIHLAAQSSVGISWKKPALTFDINVLGTINILEAVKNLENNPRVLLIGSAEQYGVINQKDIPIKEETKAHPENPYAISKATQEALAKMYVEKLGLDIVMVRAFNHIGPGQSPIFVISDFAKQVAEIEKGLREPVIRVGNLEVKRDFTDVRDIIRGYWLLLRKGKKGEIYNIGSGKSTEIKNMLIDLINLSSTDINYEVDKEKFRPADILDLRADISKIKNETGWKPEIDIKDSFKDILNYWRKTI